MVVTARMVEATASPALSAGLARLLAAVFSFGAFFCTQDRRWNRCRVWASQPWPFSTWLTMVGRRPATWLRELTSG